MRLNERKGLLMSFLITRVLMKNIRISSVGIAHPKAQQSAP